jgi:endonuclease/exonuclease/phosphatase family metal-dependent hydrolase
MGQPRATGLDDLSGDRDTPVERATEQPAPGVERLRVATWNVHEEIPVDGSSTAAAFWDALVAAGVHVAALQEVRFSELGEPYGITPVAERLAMPFWLTFPLSSSCFHDSDSVGILLLSRFPMAAERRALLPNPELHRGSNGSVRVTYDKGVLSAVVRWGGRPVRVASVHSFPFQRFGRSPDEAEFERVWSTLAKSVHPRDEEAVLVCGDFNTQRRELLTDHMDRKLYRAIGDRATHGDMAADDILFSEELELVGSVAVSTSSDHALCVAEFRQSPNRTAGRL